MADQFIPLTAVPRLNIIPRRRGGSRLHYSTLFRWTTAGVNGHKLRSVKIGAQRCTTEAWLREFFEALAAPQTKTARDHEADEQQLAAMGV